MVSDEKRNKALRTIRSLQALVDHPNTGDGERQAAMGRIKALKEKWKITDPPPRRTPPPRGRSFTDDEMWEYLRKNFAKERQRPSDTDETAARIQRERERYENWKRMNDAMNKKMAEEKAREVRERQRREEAQRRWEQRNKARDARGVPLTDDERREAMADPLGWAAKRDGRTAEQKNADLQYQYTHQWQRDVRCTEPLTFYDSGGEMRPRNSEPTVCAACGSKLGSTEGAANDQGQFQCAEMTPGPRKKKPGHG